MDKETREFLENIQNGMSEFKNEMQEFRKETSNRFDNLEGSFVNLEGCFDNLEGHFDNLEGQFKELKIGQKEIKTIVGELDPKNANRHLELQESISILRKDMSTVEIVTASNYQDIARLKSVE